MKTVMIKKVLKFKIRVEVSKLSAGSLLKSFCTYGHIFMYL